MKFGSTLAFLLASCSAVAVGAPALAQSAPEASNTSNNDVIVTAQKRTERVQDVPVSINVINGSELERSQVNNIYDLSRMAPSLEVGTADRQDVGGGGAIRGLGTQLFSATAVGAVGVVVDGVSQGNAQIRDLVDIQRVEVLKGPQGTLFGLTTSAGVINITTRTPTKEFGGRLRVEASGEGIAGSTAFGQQIYQGSLNIPLGDNAGMRISATENRKQGPGRNILDKSLDETNTWGGRGRLFIQPSDKLTLNLNADYTNTKGNGIDFFTVYLANPSLTAQLANCRLDSTSIVTPITVSDGNRDYCSPDSAPSGSINFGASASLEYDFGPFTFTSITAGRRNHSVPFFTQDITRLKNAFFAPVTNPLTNTDSKNIEGPEPSVTNLATQEFRISSPNSEKLEYTAGLFYSATTFRSFGGSRNGVRLSCSALNVCVPNGTPTIGLPSNNALLSKAVFAQSTLHLTDKFSVTTGFRYNEDVVRQHSINAAFITTDSRVENSATSYRLSGQYQIDPNFMVYAAVVRGYKGAQLAAQICPGLATCPAGTPQREVLPEIPMDYELGAKKAFFDGRLIADLNAFYIKMTNYQGQLCLTTTAFTLQCTVTNFDGVVSKGIEGNLFGRVNDNLTVNTGLLWNPATYPDKTAAGGPFLAADNTDLSGQQLQGSPEWKFTASTQYSRPVFDKMEAFVGADAVYRSAIRFAVSADPRITFHENWVIGGNAGIRSEGGKWSASVFVRNLTDEHVPVLRSASSAAGNGSSQILTTGSFRSVGLSLDTSF